MTVTKPVNVAATVLNMIPVAETNGLGTAHFHIQGRNIVELIGVFTLEK